MATTGKRTGRPAGMGDTNKRRLLDAARQQFAANDFHGVSMRSIAAQAGVDVALISHHFGSKDGLFAATVDLPESTQQILTEALSGPPHTQGERLTRGYLGLWENPVTRSQMQSLARAALNHRETAERLGESLMGITVAPELQRLLGGRRVGFSFAMTQLIGVAVARYLTRLPDLAELNFDTVVSCTAPSVQRHLDTEC